MKNKSAKNKPTTPKPNDVGATAEENKYRPRTIRKRSPAKPKEDRHPQKTLSKVGTDRQKHRDEQAAKDHAAFTAALQLQMRCMIYLRPGKSPSPLQAAIVEDLGKLVRDFLDCGYACTQGGCTKRDIQFREQQTRREGRLKAMIRKKLKEFV